MEICAWDKRSLATGHPDESESVNRSGVRIHQTVVVFCRWRRAEREPAAGAVPEAAASRLLEWLHPAGVQRAGAAAAAQGRRVLQQVSVFSLRLQILVFGLSIWTLPQNPL